MVVVCTLDGMPGNAARGAGHGFKLVAQRIFAPMGRAHDRTSVVLDVAVFEYGEGGCKGMHSNGFCFWLIGQIECAFDLAVWLDFNLNDYEKIDCDYTVFE